MAAALAALPVSAVMAFTVVMAALMPFAVMTALVPVLVMMTVVIAFGGRVILQRAVRQSLRGRVGGTGNAAVKLDVCLGQRVLRAHADAAADQRVHLRRFQEAGQRSVPAAVCGHDLFGDDLPVLYVVELELLRMAEMLKNKLPRFSCFLFLSE